MRCACTALLKTDKNLAATVARLTVGLVMLPHGLQKTVGGFGGKGFAATMDIFTSQLGLSWSVALLVILAESLGALSLLMGFMTRFCAASLAVVMIGAVLLGHAQHGFFMNWFGAQQGEGFEYHILMIGACLSLIVSGGGSLSVDRIFFPKVGLAGENCCSQ